MPMASGMLLGLWHSRKSGASPSCALGLHPGGFLPVVKCPHKVFSLLPLSPLLLGAVSGCSWITWGLKPLWQLKGLPSSSPPPLLGSCVVTGVSELCVTAGAAGRREHSCPS